MTDSKTRTVDVRPRRMSTKPEGTMTRSDMEVTAEELTQKQKDSTLREGADGCGPDHVRGRPHEVADHKDSVGD